MKDSLDYLTQVNNEFKEEIEGYENREEKLKSNVNDLKCDLKDENIQKKSLSKQVTELENINKVLREEFEEISDIKQSQESK